MKHTSKGSGLPASPRPRRVTILALGVLIMACLSLTRVILTIRDWDFLSQQAGASPLYLLLTGLIGTIVGARAGYGLWWMLPWGADFIRGLSLVYSLYAWLERLFLYDRPALAPAFQPLLPGNWMFLVGLNLLLLVWVFWTSKSIGEADE